MESEPESVGMLRMSQRFCYFRSEAQFTGLLSSFSYFPSRGFLIRTHKYFHVLIASCLTQTSPETGSRVHIPGHSGELLQVGQSLSRTQVWWERCWLLWSQTQRYCKTSQHFSTHQYQRVPRKVIPPYRYPCRVQFGFPLEVFLFQLRSTFHVLIESCSTGKLVPYFTLHTVEEGCGQWYLLCG
jgi:hypothetical protein